MIWIGYVFMSALNGYVAYAFTTEQWVNFKIWGYGFHWSFCAQKGLYIASTWNRLTTKHSIERCPTFSLEQTFSLPCNPRRWSYLTARAGHSGAQR
jgi:hypothetical protein